MGTKKGGQIEAGDDAADTSDRSGLKSKTIRLDVEMIGQVQELADARGMSFSAVMRAAGEMYLAREVFAVGLAEVEERIGATLKAVMKDTHRVADDVQLTIAFMDQLTRFVLMATPDVIDKEGAVALGNRRYKGFLAEFHKSFNNRLGQSRLAQELDGLDSANTGG